MNKIQRFIVGCAVFAFATFLLLFSPAPASAEGQGKGAFACEPRVHHMMGGDAPLISIALRHKTELNLIADQVANLEKIRTTYQNQTTPLHEQLRGNEREIAALREESPANLIQIKLKIEQAERLRSELRYLRIEALENGKSILTEQQRIQLKNLVASRHRDFHRPGGQAS